MVPPYLGAMRFIQSPLVPVMVPALSTELQEYIARQWGYMPNHVDDWHLNYEPGPGKLLEITFTLELVTVFWCLGLHHKHHYYSLDQQYMEWCQPALWQNLQQILHKFFEFARLQLRQEPIRQRAAEYHQKQILAWAAFQQLRAHSCRLCDPAYDPFSDPKYNPA